jgi:hypothetical protein
LIETAPQNCTVIQMSTVSPNLTRRLGNAVAAKTLGFLDAPMSGTSAMVERGDCAIFVAGDRSRAEACQPIFDAIARKTHYVGDAGMASPRSSRQTCWSGSTRLRLQRRSSSAQKAVWHLACWLKFSKRVLGHRRWWTCVARSW